MSPTSKLLLLASLLSPSTATNLYVAASDGVLSTLNLVFTESSYSLTNTSSTPDCAGNPSWLTLDSEARILYCLDRGTTGALNGSINSFEIGNQGNLSRLYRVDAPLSGVYSNIFGTRETKRGMAAVSYNTSAGAIYSLGDAGLIEGPLETFYPKLAAPGPVPLRQDLSYLHQVILDPQSKFLIMNDLGADLVRVFSWDAATLSPLTELPSLQTDPGAGPRHGVFWTSPSGAVFYIFVGEISQYVYTYSVAYTDTGIEFTRVGEIPALGVGNEKPPQTAPTSGIALSPDNKFLLVSNRDISFPNSTQYQSGLTDTLSSFSINDDGSLTLIQLAPSGGYLPRHFSLNAAGTLVAVGHQTNKTVVIWRRDVESGLLETEEPAASVVLGGSVSCTIWDE